MKRRFLNIILSLCMVLSLFGVMAVNLPTEINADGTGSKSVMLGMGNIDGWNSTDGYDYLYFGNYNGAPVKWRVLDDQTNMGTDGYFLLSDSRYPGTIFDSNSNMYQGSDAQSWCNNFANQSFTYNDNALIILTTKDDAACSYSFSNFWYTEKNLNGDNVFFLSAEEYMNDSYGLTANYEGLNVIWWSRSPGNNKSFSTGSTPEAGQLGGISQVYATPVTYSRDARPALNFDGSKVLFVSAALGGESRTFSSVSDYTGKEWKPTVLISDRDMTVTETSIKGAPGRYTTEFTYSVAAGGENEYISGMIVDEGGSVLYYGNIARCRGNGTAKVLLPEDIEDGSYTLRIFSEQCNGDYNTNYAGNYDTVTLSVESGVHLSSHDGATFNTALSSQIAERPEGGCYYLTSDITSGSIYIENGVTVTVCLNGHEWKPTLVTVKSGGTLNICDCSGGKGTVTNSSNYVILNQGTLNITDGTVTNTSNNFVIYNYAGNMEISGGRVINKGTGVAVYNDSGSTLYLSEDVEISSSGDADVYTKNDSEFYACGSESYLPYSGNVIRVSYNSPAAGALVLQYSDDKTSHLFEYAGKGYFLERVNNTLVLKKHEHIWAETLTADNGAHWYECTVDNCDITVNSEKSGYAEHTFGTLIEKVDATCMADGTEAHYICEDCDSYFTSEKVKTDKDSLKLVSDPAYHSYGEPHYLWSEDNTTCTASMTCAHNSEHTVTEDGTVTPNVTQNQSCETEELTTFTAVFTNEAFLSQIKENQKTKDSLGHDFESTSEYIKVKDGHQKKCARCEEHSALEPHTDADENAICDICQNITFDGEGTKESPYIVKTVAALIAAMDSTENEVNYISLGGDIINENSSLYDIVLEETDSPVVLDLCGYTLYMDGTFFIYNDAEIKNGKLDKTLLAVRSFAEVSITDVDMASSETAISVNGATVTVINSDMTATECNPGGWFGPSYLIKSYYGNITLMNVTLVDECGIYSIEYSELTIDGVLQDEVLVSELKEYHTHSDADGDCVCDREGDACHSGTESKLLSLNNGTHNVLWSCCDMLASEGVACTENNPDSNCTTLEKCLCGYTVTAAKSHAFDNDCDTDCNNDGCLHTRVTEHVPSSDDGSCETEVLCSVCNETVTAAKTHAFDNDCDTDCNNDGCLHTRVTEHVPSSDDGDCTTEVLCSVCGTVTTNKNTAHDFSGEYLSDADGHWHKCKNCDKTDEKTAHVGNASCTEAADCTACGKSFGHALGHDFSVSEGSETEHWKRCSRCDTTDGKAAHEYTDGLCSCGQEKPGLSGGAIAGITVGSVTGAGGLGFALWWFIFRRKRTV